MLKRARITQASLGRGFKSHGETLLYEVLKTSADSHERYPDGYDGAQAFGPFEPNAIIGTETVYRGFETESLP